MKRPRSGLEILIDRACGFTEPSADERDLLVKFATAVALDVADYAISFLGLKENDPRAVGLKQSVADFINFDYANRIAPKEPS